MLLGIKFKAKPTPSQAAILSSWMGGAKFVWNAKCDEDKYLRSYAQKYLTIGTYPKPDQTYSQYRSKEFSPFLKSIPSQILRNSVSNWFDSYQKFFKITERGRPKRKKRGSGLSIHLTRELFEIKNTEEGLKLFIGTKKNNIGFLDVNWHTRKWRQYGNPNSIRIKKSKIGKFSVSFCYGPSEKKNQEKEERKHWFKHIQKNYTKDELEKEVVGIDRGIHLTVATNHGKYPFKEKTLKNLKKYEKRMRKAQKCLSKKQKGSKRRQKQKLKVARVHNKKANIRDNECHHISKKLVTQEQKIFVFEALPIKNQTKSSKGTQENPGKNVRAKSGLNRSILNMAWGKIEIQLKYKARLRNKVVYKINPAYTSQECANCGHTHSNNRDGIHFSCGMCNHKDHADLNAAKVIKKRAINYLLDSGTELSDKGVLRPTKDIGHGNHIRPPRRNPKRQDWKTLSKGKKCQKREESRFPSYIL